jgi:hypothetical protein
MAMGKGGKGNSLLIFFFVLCSFFLRFCGCVPVKVTLCLLRLCGFALVAFSFCFLLLVSIVAKGGAGWFSGAFSRLRRKGFVFTP